jgi:caffeoyl-CoA O-methyltransferase
MVTGMKSISLTPELYTYLLDHSSRETNIQRRLGAETEKHEWSMMLSPPEVAQFLGLLVELIDARKCLEVGVYTGYTTLAIAQALPADGRVTACDTDADTAEIGRPYWREAGVEDRIDLRIAPATETLQALIDDGEAGTYDFAFIDADKVGYAGYYEQILSLLRPRGLMVTDNVLWNGSVADPDNSRESTVALRAYNDMVHADDRVTMSLLPVGDGLMLAVKRG